MKGIVFTGFMEMVEQNHGYDFLDDLLLTTKDITGSYTSVGTYSHVEMVNLVVSYSEKTGLPQENVLEKFGEFLFQMFLNGYPSFFEESNTFKFLSGINNHIHTEVLKLYPDAELPHFEIEMFGNDKMTMNYLSDRSMSHLALGLIKSTADYFNDEVDIEHKMLNQNGSRAFFEIKKKHV